MYKDPITGDELTRLEYYTRKVQVYVRTPWFIVVFNVITVAMLTHGLEFKWNDFASWLAVMIEWLVGTYMFGQTARDAVHTRHIDKVVQRLELLEERVLSAVTIGNPAPQTPEPQDPAPEQTPGSSE